MVKLARVHPGEGEDNCCCHQLSLSTVTKVKQQFRMIETSATTNGPQGTVYHKTQISLQLLSRSRDESFDKQHTSNEPRL